MEEKGIPAELVKHYTVDTFENLEEESELEESIEHYKEQQLLFREALNKHFRAQRRSVSILMENFEELGHASRHLKKHVEMVQTQYEQIAQTRALLLEQGSLYKAIATNVVTRGGAVIKGPPGPPHWQALHAQQEKDTQEMTQEENLADSQDDVEYEAQRKERQSSLEDKEEDVGDQNKEVHSDAETIDPEEDKEVEEEKEETPGNLKRNH
jgi:hypothetical protein